MSALTFITLLAIMVVLMVVLIMSAAMLLAHLLGIQRRRLLGLHALAVRPRLSPRKP